MAAGDLAPTPPSAIPLSYITFLTAPPQFNSYFANINFWFKSFPL